ncbi:MAG: hypothetical protein ACE5NA_07310 [Nitrospiraceae bacterium]
MNSVLTRQVRREHGVKHPAVLVTSVPMAMVSLGVNVDEWDSQHPKHQPQ